MEQKAELTVNDQSEKKGFSASCFEWVEALIPALIIILILFTLLFRVITINGPSMMPNLKDSYKVFVSCAERNFSTGDIVVIDGRATSLNKTLVKRVIATEGQTVNIDFQKGVVTVDGKELDESAYIENGITKDQYDVTFPQKVPAGHVFVLGDNRVVSEDSRFSAVGMIDQRYILGKVKCILLPFSSFGKLK
ncbi:MAG TPA: signal peptidase I [Caproiciproducens sp.]|nr:signal peptidase I [Caproiciproducens sp.]